MAKFVFLLVALAMIQASWALKCKRCNNECDKVDEDICLNPSANQEVACLTEIYKDGAKKQMTDKKCVIYQKGTTYQCPRQPGTEPVSCVTCKDKDFCNSAENLVATTTVAMVGAVLALLVPRFL